MRIVILDTGPLALVTNPAANDQASACREWLEGIIGGGAVVGVPEIADYELRRELMRANKAEGLARLDALCGHPAVFYIPLTTRAMRMAAEFWAKARQRHRPTAPDPALDADMILAAQARLAGMSDHVVTVATTNVGHLADFTDAANWADTR